MSSTTTSWSNESNTKADSTIASTVSDVNIAATSKLYLDGGGNTYLTETSADLIDIFAGGVKSLSIASNTLVINEGSADYDFRVEGNGQANLLFCDAGNDRIGIGTATPGNKLTVDAEAIGDGIDIIDGDITHGMTSYLPTDAVLRLTTQHATEGGGRILGATENTGQHGLTIYGLCPDSPTATLNNIQLIGAQANSANIQVVDADKQVLQVKNYTTALMTILGNGNVGIGTTTPDHILNLSKDGAACVLSIDAFSDTASHAPSIYFRKADGTEADPDLVAAADNLGQMVWYGWDLNSGGEYIESAKIFVKAGSPTVGENDMPGTIYFSTTGDTGTSAEDRMVIDYAGNVGIGTDSPSAKFEIFDGTPETSGSLRYSAHIVDDTALAAGNGSGILFTGRYTDGPTYSGLAGIDAYKTSGSASNSGGELAFHTRLHGGDLVEAMRIDDDGNVGIGTSSPTSQLHVDQASASGAVPVLKLDQADVDDTFIDFIGTSASDGSKSISSDTTEDSAKFGAIRIEINGTTKWIRVYDDQS